MIQKLTCTWHKHKNRQKGQENAEELRPMITSQRSNPSESKNNKKIYHVNKFSSVTITMKHLTLNDWSRGKQNSLFPKGPVIK